MSKLAVNLLTGFLGSGKTTLLRHVLASPVFQDCAVLINEFGEIGLDHHLLQKLDDDIVLMQSGCICCTIRGDLSRAIRNLHERRDAGTLPPFRRLIVETTGLADPTPILSTVMNEPVIRHHFRLGNVVTTVDAVNGMAHLDRQPEAVKQVSVADRILLTKVDLVSQTEAGALERRLRRLNPAASIQRSANAPPPPETLLVEDSLDPATKELEVRRWLAAMEAEADPAGSEPDHHHHDVNRHDQHIQSFALAFEGQIDWTVFGLWLTLLLHSHGEDVLRVKGILNVAGTPTPIVVQGVQHLVHPPLHLDAWRDADRRSRIIFITHDISRSTVERSFAAFQAALGSTADHAA